MIRRVILATCLLGIVGGGAGAAFADGPAKADDHQLCVVLAKDPNHQHTQDYCIDWNANPTH